METPLPLEQYRLLVEHAPTLVWRSGVDGLCTYFNTTWLRFTGRTLEHGWAPSPPCASPSTSRSWRSGSRRSCGRAAALWYSGRMFLKDVEKHEGTGHYAELIRRVRGSGAVPSGLWYLFAFKPEMTEALGQLTQAVMRGPSPLPAGMRELIAAFTSRRNQCVF
jgi:PAS domain-containing protein